MFFIKFRFILLIIYFFASFFDVVKAQENEIESSERDSLIVYFSKIATSRNDSEKKILNNQVLDIIGKLIQDETNLKLLDSVPHLGKLVSNDKKLRIINWNLVFEDGSFEYFAFLLYLQKGDLKYTIYPLIDKSRTISDADEAILTSQTWMGALYYQIIETKRNGVICYTLLGWDGYNEMKNRKIIEVLHFPKNGGPKFGAPIFGKENYESKRRIIFEYTNRASMILSYNENAGMIVFDHLAPSDAAYKGQFQYYGPDGSHDGFKYKRGKWIFLENIDVRNTKEYYKKKKKRTDNF